MEVVIMYDQEKKKSRGNNVPSEQRNYFINVYAKFQGSVFFLSKMKNLLIDVWQNILLT